MKLTKKKKQLLVLAVFIFGVTGFYIADNLTGVYISALLLAVVVFLELKKEDKK